ncbi:opioid growth factor receptor-like protein 1 isoform X2 [Trichomycterus rosablanca]|uniref:opioid growth factor receptor-like protein 1 isoform X2 n=1 Tax=Trichomycterus rosablanca TaxID=2290929 RepID=UPI002F35A288
MGCTQSVKEDSDYTYDSTWESDDNNAEGTQTSSKQVLESDVRQDRSRCPTIKKKNLQCKSNSCFPYKGKPKRKHQSSELQTWRAYRNVQAAKDMQTYRHKCRAVLQRVKRDNDYKLGHTQLQKRVRTPSALTSALWCGSIKQIWNSRGPETSLKSTERERVHKRRYTETSCDDDDLPNLQFYRNKKKSIPDGVKIDDIHNHWARDYQKLESVHSYIQWLFPLQEQGVNPYATALTEKEIKLFHEDEEVKKRLLKSYNLMLDFYGIKLLNQETGEVDRRRNWRERFENLNRNTHNNLRITRILSCLGLLGFSHYQPPLVKFFLYETLVRKTLPRVKQSVLDYFMFTVLDKEKRKKLIAFAFNHFETEEDFVWCPRRIQKKLLQENRRTSTK